MYYKQTKISVNIQNLQILFSSIWNYKIKTIPHFESTYQNLVSIEKFKTIILKISFNKLALLIMQYQIFNFNVLY